MASQPNADVARETQETRELLDKEPPVSGAKATTKPTRFYHPELDGMRFFAFFAVFVFHSLPKDDGLYTSHHLPSIVGGTLAAISRTGRFGVDLFFVLSGYLITE